MKLYANQLFALFLSFSICATAAQNSNNNRPIFDDVFDAVKKDDSEAIRTRIAENPASLEEIGPGGQTPLVHAVLMGKLAAVKTLLDLGADTLATEKDGYNVLHAAGFQGRAEILQVLLDHNAATQSEALNLVTDQHKDGYYPIHRACWGREDRHSETVRLMLKNGVPHDLASRDGKTCQQMTRNEGTIAALLEAQDSYEL